MSFPPRAAPRPDPPESFLQAEDWDSPEPNDQHVWENETKATPVYTSSTDVAHPIVSAIVVEPHTVNSVVHYKDQVNDVTEPRTVIPVSSMAHERNERHEPNEATRPSHDDTVRRALLDQGYSHGLIDALYTNQQAFAQAIWVVDNSGSMVTRDGHRIVPVVHDGTTSFATVPCARWTELQQTVEYHAQMAALMHSPTTFRLLNHPGCVVGPQIFGIALDHATHSNLDQELAVALSTLQNASPRGVTPLTQHVVAIREHILSLSDELESSGRKVAVILATDGVPSDAWGYTNETVHDEFRAALRSLEGLPVWIVVQLCTDEEDVVQYWNDMDAQLELSLEVLDDYSSEANEVHAHNPWLTYGLPLHRLREMGFYHTVLDALDERPLSRDELHTLIQIVVNKCTAPDPEVDWTGFHHAVQTVLETQGPVWDPVSKQSRPWIDMERLQTIYGPQ